MHTWKGSSATVYDRQGTVIFIDENLEAQKIGVLSIAWPPAPQQIIQRIRERHNIYDEIKWAKTSRLKYKFYKELIDNFFNNRAFGRMNVWDITSTVDNAIFSALSNLKWHCAPYNGIFIDDRTTPKGYDFERTLQKSFDCNCIMRMDSKASQLLQLCDLMLNLVIKAGETKLPQSPHKAALVEAYRQASSEIASPRCFHNRFQA